MRSSFLCLLLIFFSCSNQRKEDSREISQDSDNLKFPLLNPVVITDQLDSVATQELDSLLRVKWTDKIMPMGLVKSRLYSARPFAKYNSVGNFDVVAVNTRADDWEKSFLITTDKKKNLIDHVLITDWWSDASQNEKGEEIVSQSYARTRFVNDSSFIRTTIEEEIWFYEQSDERRQQDSIIHRLKINSHGKFVVEKIDSIRSIKEKLTK